MATRKTPTKKTADPLARLTLGGIWLAAAVLFGLGALAAALLLPDTSYSLTQTHLTQDLLLSTNDAHLINAAKPMFDLEIRWALTGLMLLSMVLPILYLSRWRDSYNRAIGKGRVWPWRWVDLGVTSAIMIELLAVMDGYSDIATLKLMAGAMVTTTALGWLAERQNEPKSRRPDWSAFGLSLLAGSLPWIMIGAAKVSTLLFGDVRSPWYVYAACISTLIGFSLLALNQFNQHRRFKSWANYAVVERNYALISIITKLAFVGIIIAGLR